MSKEISMDREDDEAREMMESRRTHKLHNFMAAALPLMILGTRLGSGRGEKQEYPRERGPKVRKSKGTGGQGGKRA